MIKIVVRRLLFLIMVIWAASTIVFFIPRISDKNPVRERFATLAVSGGFSPTDLEIIIDSYNTKFGLDKPLLVQYKDYMLSIARFDLGVSFNKYPKTVMGLIMDSLPWTIVLLLVTTVLSFVFAGQAQRCVLHHFIQNDFGGASAQFSFGADDQPVRQRSRGQVFDIIGQHMLAPAHRGQGLGGFEQRQAAARTDSQ